MVSVTRPSLGITADDPCCILQRAVCDLTDINNRLGLLATEAKDANRLDMSILYLRVDLEQTICSLESAGHTLADKKGDSEPKPALHISSSIVK